jgi:hypothetical protein
LKLIMSGSWGAIVNVNSLLLRLRLRLRLRLGWCG